MLVVIVVSCLAAGFITTTGAEVIAATSVGSNLVVNPSLEDGTSFPTCYSANGWGTAGVWSLTAGHTGQRAVTVQISNYSSGDQKLLQSETTSCAPAVSAGAVYNLGVWYKSTVPVSLTMFRHTSSGWAYWGDIGTVPSSGTWAQAVGTTPAIPAGTDQIAFGLSINANGTLTTDDYSLFATALPTAPPPGQLVSNGNLSQGTPMPDCFISAGWGNRSVTEGLSTDVPTNSAAGTRSYTYTVSSYVSGDVKLLESQTPGCAPSVAAGSQYNVSIDYKSTSANNSLTVFKHDSTGWSYWTDMKTLPAASSWTTATALSAPIPSGVDSISFGISLSGNGTLFTTNYSLQLPAPPPTSGTPSQVGSWQVLGTNMPIRNLHSTLLSDGRLLMIAGSGNDGNAFAAGTFKATVWNPNANTFTDVPVPYDMFCVGHATLPDGKVLVAGGTAAYPTASQGPTTFTGSAHSYYFDPKDNQFHPLLDMQGAHWYPTLTKLGNGDIWAAGGLNENASGSVLTEMFSSSAMGWLNKNNVPQTWSFWGLYPHMYLLNDGRLFYSGGHTFGNGLPGSGASLYNWQTAQMWDVAGLRNKDLRDQAGSVLLPPAQDQRVMIVGGGNTQTNTPAINQTDIIDLSQANPAYVPGPDLPGPGKLYLNLLNLPDRTVFSANGAQYNRSGNVDTAAIYRPSSNDWLSIDPDPVSRNYHSSAILLPDGRVAVFGSNPLDNTFELRISVYSPPYLFQNGRPGITQAPASATYGQSFGLQVSGTVKSASLMSPMSATHQTDTNARLVDLPLSGSGTSLTATVPANSNLLPPGPYMLTVLDTNNVPSVAKWVWIS